MRALAMPEYFPLTRLTRLSPSRGAPGELFTIYGRNLGSRQGSNIPARAPFKRYMLLFILLLILASPQLLFVKGLLKEDSFMRTTSSSSLFNPIISSVSDKAGDVPSKYGYIDIVYAEVRQINLDTLQFEMRVKSPIPLDPGNGARALHVDH